MHGEYVPLRRKLVTTTVMDSKDRDADVSAEAKRETEKQARSLRDLQPL
jgi:hypothetical protein